MRSYSNYRWHIAERNPRDATCLLLLLSVLAGCTSTIPGIDAPEQTVTDTAIPLYSTATQSSLTPTEEVDPYYQRRLKMVKNTIEARGVRDARVLEAMRSVPRHRFVPADYLEFAYDDNPLPIGYGQTISQPYIVALMTGLLDLTPGEKVLEIGTGSGYQAAILAAWGGLEVYSVEIIPELAESAAARLRELDYTDIQVMTADGYFGWVEHAPFYAIVVTAAPDHLPAPLVEQLVPGGRLVIPIGPPGGFQTLWKFVFENGELKAYNLGSVAFVPFTGSGIVGGTPGPTISP